MRLALGALLLMSLDGAAADAPLRFVIPDSWAMPMVQLEHGRPTQGILYDVMLSLATQVGVPARIPRAAPRHGCRAPWNTARSMCAAMPRSPGCRNQSGDYIWSIPLGCSPTCWSAGTTR